ncbi:palindromic element RPE4 domain-containing protein [Rickettsia asembonensis]
MYGSVSPLSPRGLTTGSSKKIRIQKARFILLYTGSRGQATG